MALWIASAIWMATIFIFSADSAAESEGKSGAVFSLISGFLHDGGILPPIEPLDATAIIRKTAHLAEYFILGLLATAAWAASLGEPGGRAQIGLAGRYGAALGIAYAATDELHQFFVPGRAAMLTDVMLDGIGAVAGAAAMALLCEAAIRRAESPPRQNRAQLGQQKGGTPRKWL
ncbi:MAG: VanZ family protein [Clostridiales bacterium]|nr:VanZ family protein [Clostridiales bacterium]